MEKRIVMIAADAMSSTSWMWRMPPKTEGNKQQQRQCVPTYHSAFRPARKGRNPGTPSSSAPLQYEFKVLSSSGKTSQLPVQLFVGSGGLQGFRPTMEDEHFNLISAATTPDGQPHACPGRLRVEVS
ncbi:protein phosphatase 2C, putative [Bodo saltans]|uniref:Protein phosphatase 2C, putative n=1 Tax=Bodo saltans TaxID=75058 RepID=A0A0S4IVZ2_BODSA|nr:protein phosphatase 2C, putative [Bodo saltans]|eukprot:CUG05418.1 protein phosphatase 2C, putative [Bodo saltans]